MGLRVDFDEFWDCKAGRLWAALRLGLMIFKDSWIESLLNA
jgi:hypothetical protein